MPVTVPIPHDSYSCQLKQGALDLSTCRCPRCLGRTERELPAALVLTKARVQRRVWTLGREDEEGFRRLSHRARAGDRGL